MKRSADAASSELVSAIQDEFIRVQAAAGFWLSACEKCWQVLAMGDSLESLQNAEAAATHNCHAAKQEAAEADVA